MGPAANIMPPSNFFLCIKFHRRVSGGPAAALAFFLFFERLLLMRRIMAWIIYREAEMSTREQSGTLSCIICRTLI